MHQELINFSGQITINDIINISKKVGINFEQLKTDMNKDETILLIKENYRLADLIGVRGTPAFIINKELIHFSDYDCKRSIPNMLDGLKPSLRKIMFSCLKRNLKKGIELGLYRKEIMIEAIGRLYFAGMSSLKDVELFPTEMFNVKDLQNQYLEYHLRGICTKKGIDNLEKLIKANL